MKIIQALNISLKEIQNLDIISRAVPLNITSRNNIKLLENGLFCSPRSKNNIESVSKFSAKKIVKNIRQKFSSSRWDYKLRTLQNCGLILTACNPNFGLYPIHMISRKCSSHEKDSSCLFDCSGIEDSEFNCEPVDDSVPAMFDYLLKSVRTFVGVEDVAARTSGSGVVHAKLKTDNHNATKEGNQKFCPNEYYDRLVTISNNIPDKLLQLISPKIAKKMMIEEMLRLAASEGSVSLLEKPEKQGVLDDDYSDLRESYIYSTGYLCNKSFCRNNYISDIATERYKLDIESRPRRYCVPQAKKGPTLPSYLTTNQFHTMNTFDCFRSMDECRSYSNSISEKNSIIPITLNGIDQQVLERPRSPDSWRKLNNFHSTQVVRNEKESGRDDWLMDSRKINTGESTDYSPPKDQVDSVILSNMASTAKSLMDDESIDKDENRSLQNQKRIKSNPEGVGRVPNIISASAVDSSDILSEVSSNLSTDMHTSETIRPIKPIEISHPNLAELKPDKPESLPIAEPLTFRPNYTPEFIKPHVKDLSIHFEEDLTHIAMFDSFCTPLSGEHKRENIVPIRLIDCEEFARQINVSTTSKRSRKDFRGYLKNFYEKILNTTGLHK